jgi:hypothetical protein
MWKSALQIRSTELQVIVDFILIQPLVAAKWLAQASLSDAIKRAGV